MSSLKVPKKSRIIIAPYSPNTRALKQYLEKNYEIEFIGYADKEKKNEKTSTYESLSSLKYDKVLVYSPNHGIEIYKTVKKQTQRVELVYLEYNRFCAGYRNALIKRYYQNLQMRVIEFCNRRIKRFIVQKNLFMCISADFIDNNIKDFYVSCEKDKHYKLLLATDNMEHYKLFKSFGFNVVLFPSWKFVFFSIISQVKILDHTPTSKYIKKSLIHSKKIQLWHGIPLKAIGRFANYKEIWYDIVLSTSPFVTKFAFSKVFRAKKIVEFNYPRNEVLFEEPVNPKRLVLVDKKVYNFCQKTNLDVVIYMPTYRNSNVQIPVDYDDLELFAKENNLFFIIKLHPFVMQKMREKPHGDVEKFKNFKNICFYPDGKDIYPILPLSKMLITDYSSVIIYF